MWQCEYQSPVHDTSKYNVLTGHHGIEVTQRRCYKTNANAEILEMVTFANQKLCYSTCKSWLGVGGGRYIV